MNKKRKILILFPIIIIFIALIVFVALYKNESDTIFVVTTENEMNFMPGDSMSYGYNFKILKEIADSLGMNLNIEVDDDEARRYRRLGYGKYDLILDLVPVTTKSIKHCKFTKPVMLGHLVLVQRCFEDDSVNITSIEQLDGKLIYVEKGSYYDTVLDNLQEELGITFKIKQLPKSNYDDICRMVSNEEIDYGAVINHSAEMAVAKYENLDIKLDLGFNQFLAWPVSGKKESLRNQLDSLLLTSFSLSHIDK